LFVHIITEGCEVYVLVTNTVLKQTGCLDLK